MRILEIEIQGYKSFKSVKLDQLGKLVILIGKNGTGKSNLLELIEFLFRDLDALPQKALGAANEHLWHGFEIGEPILVHVRVEVDGEALSRSLPKEFAFTPPKTVAIDITRAVEQSAGNMEWRTRELTIGERKIVSAGAVRKSEELAISEAELKVAGEGSTPGPAAPADLPQKILQAVSQVLLARFQVIPSARNRQFTPAGNAARVSVLDDQTLTQIQTLAQLVKPGERRRKFNPLQRSLKEIIPNAEGISAPQGQVFVQEGRLEIPLALTGGGVQEIVNVLCRIQALQQAREGSVIGIEEPEAHLHPDAMKLLLGHLRAEETVSQYWITTHSPFLIDRADLESVWMVSKNDGTSDVGRLTDANSLRTAFLDLGIRPSDVLYSDAVLLVEGDSDVEFYRGMALKMGFPEIEFVSIIPTGGVPQEKHHLEMWSDISKRTQLPVFLLLDSDARKELDELVRGKLVDPRNASCLAGGSLEDQYPHEKLLRALKEEFGLEPKQDKLPTSKMAAFLEQELHAAAKDKRSWKKRLAIRMVRLMEPAEAPEPLRSLLHTIRAELAGPSASR
jgi:predicted ATP-dependent endonuclease of OLD family